ncbi:MAG: YbbR-like domain-containing protein [Bacteroidales bacterium]|nr:YbbR-like domain-containing protein [Bacteroidales bacterium]
MKVEFGKFFTRVRISLARRLRVQLSVFLVCLFIAVGIWLIIKLSKEYTEPLKFPIAYSNIPENRILTGSIDSTLRIKLRATGFQLLSYMWFENGDTVRVDLSQLNLLEKDEHFEGYFTKFKLNEMVSNNLQIPPKQIASIKPDTLLFKLHKTQTRIVPVRLDLDLSFANQYFLYDSLEPNPKTVTITGIGEDVEKVEHIFTQKKKIKNIRHDRTVQVDLKIPEAKKRLKLNPEKVTVDINVETYTESTIRVPILHINEDTNFRIKTFPQEVEVTFLVALKDYRDIESSMFSLGVDAQMGYMTNTKQLKVKVIDKPGNVRITNIKPGKVEYIILQ